MDPAAEDLAAADLRRPAAGAPGMSLEQIGQSAVKRLWRQKSEFKARLLRLERPDTGLVRRLNDRGPQGVSNPSARELRPGGEEPRSRPGENCAADARRRHALNGYMR